MDQLANFQHPALKKVHYFSSIDSTNVEAHRHLGWYLPGPTLILADKQTAGKGRFQRQWFSPSRVGLWFTLILSPEETKEAYLQRLALYAGLCVAETVENLYGIEARVKWPNDVLIQGRKLAGVLVENAWLGNQLQATLVGVGVNINQTIQDFPPGISSATSLLLATGSPKSRSEFLSKLLNYFFQNYPMLGSGEKFQSEYHTHAAYLGQKVTVTTETQSWDGIFKGITPDGRARLELLDGTEIELRDGHLILSQES